MEDCTKVGSRVEYLICESGGFIVHHTVVSCNVTVCRVECASQSDLCIGEDEFSSLFCMVRFNVEDGEFDKLGDGGKGVER